MAVQSSEFKVVGLGADPTHRFAMNGAQRGVLRRDELLDCGTWEQVVGVGFFFGWAGVARDFALDFLVGAGLGELVGNADAVVDGVVVG